MKITATKLSEIIKEQVKKIVSEAPVKKPDPLEAAKALLADMQKALVSGDLKAVSDEKLDSLRSAMRSARAKSAAASRSPEKKAAASKKGAETRATRKGERDEFMQNYKIEQERREAALADRRNKGLLPLVVIAHNGEPNKKFYDMMTNHVMGPDGFSLPKFALKDEFVNRKFNPATRDMIVNGAESIFDPELMDHTGRGVRRSPALRGSTSGLSGGWNS